MVFGQAVGGEAQPSSSRHCFANAIFIPGPLHILHNAMKTVSTHMNHWPLFEGQLKTMADLVSAQCLELFVEKCVRGGPYDSAKNMFARSNFPSLIDWRWGQCRGFIDGLLKVMKVLRASWSTDKMCAGALRTAERPIKCCETLPTSRCLRSFGLTDNVSIFKFGREIDIWRRPRRICVCRCRYRFWNRPGVGEHRSVFVVAWDSWAFGRSRFPV